MFLKCTLHSYIKQLYFRFRLVPVHRSDSDVRVGVQGHVGALLDRVGLSGGSHLSLLSHQSDPDGCRLQRKSIVIETAIIAIIIQWKILMS